MDQKPVDQWSVSELKRFLDEEHIDYSDCLEKTDFVQLARNALGSKSTSASSTASTTTPTPAPVPPQPPPAPAPAPAPSATAPEPTEAAGTENLSKPTTHTIKPNYYDVLEITKDATQAAVTKAYYRLARIYHPDKNPDDPTTEERFKLISEAYQILSDPEKRAHYDKFGSADMDADPRELFRMLFGGGRFDEFFRTPLAGFFDLEGTTEQEFQARFEQMRENARRELGAKLIERLARVMSTKMTAQAKQAEAAEAAEMAEAPGGAELLYLVGYCYVQEARQFGASFLGIGSFISEMKEKAHLIREAFSAMSSAVRMQTMQRQEGGQDEAAMIQQGLKTIWKSGKLEIEITVRAVCEFVLGNPEPSQAQLRQQRCKALEWLGLIYKVVGKAAMKVSGVSGPPKI